MRSELTRTLPLAISFCAKVRVLTTRAMGNWERILPRVAPALAPDGIVLLWAGDAVREIAQREAWSKLSLVARHALPGRHHSWIWCFRRTPGGA